MFGRPRTVKQYRRFLVGYHLARGERAGRGNIAEMLSRAVSAEEHSLSLVRRIIFAGVLPLKATPHRSVGEQRAVVPLGYVVCCSLGAIYEHRSGTLLFERRRSVNRAKSFLLPRVGVLSRPCGEICLSRGRRRNRKQGPPIVLVSFFSFINLFLMPRWR